MNITSLLQSEPKGREEEFSKIRILTIISLYSDDDLMDILVLKGGNALEIAHKMFSRASQDIDVSMKRDFIEENLTIEVVEGKLESSLNRTFEGSGYIPFGVKIEEKPRRRREGHLPEWGGYKASFKIIKDTDPYAMDTLNRIHRADKVEIDISKYEYIDNYEEIELFDGFYIKVYSLKMIVFEKLRAICQQMDEYDKRTNKTPRSRDFYDIYIVCESDHSKQIDFKNHEDRELLRKFFEAKEVSLELISKIKDTRDFHINDYQTVMDSARDKDIKHFDFYFNYVLQKVEELESFWIE